jgi:hypothetical protein
MNIKEKKLKILGAIPQNYLDSAKNLSQNEEIIPDMGVFYFLRFFGYFYEFFGSCEVGVSY